MNETICTEHMVFSYFRWAEKMAGKPNRAGQEHRTNDGGGYGNNGNGGKKWQRAGKPNITESAGGKVVSEREASLRTLARWRARRTE